ncbi:MAG TPA: MFS transporter [Pilimelia sp.]|nr:MFS transporter [Pilimelia sp.]
MPRPPAPPLSTAVRRSQVGWVVAAQAMSVIGTQVTALALPTIAIVVLGASPLWATGLFAVEYLVSGALAPFAGVLVDRGSPRRLLVAAEVAGALVAVSVPVAGLAGALSMTHLYAVAAVTGFLGGLADVALPVLIPRLATPDGLVSANAAVAGGRALAGIGGPALGGVVVQLLGAATAMAVEAATCLVAAALLGALRLGARPPEPGRTDRARPLRAIRDGAAVLARHPLLLRMAVAGAVLNLGGAVLGALYVLYCYRSLHLSPAAVGLTFAVYSLATLAGIWLAPRIDRRFGLGRVVRTAALVAAGSLLLIPAASVGQPVSVLLAYQLVFGLSAATWGIAVITIQQRVVPPGQLGTVLALTRSIGVAAIPLGAIGGGALAEGMGVLPVMVVAAAIAAAGTAATMSRGAGDDR